MITRSELIKEYIEFFKKHGHKHIPSASIIPDGVSDTGVLFTTAGMHPLVPFLLGEKHPLGKRLVSVQKCIRTGDIEEVGDTTHHTFFEMLGNWSLGDYFKKESIKLSYDFLTEILKIPKEKLAVSVFKGDKTLKTAGKKDEESKKIWESLGINEKRIAFLPKENNWWGPAGETGPCGPDTEIFYWKPPKEKPPKEFNPEDENWVEIWNNVFMKYNKTKNNQFLNLNQKNVDTGMGVERTLASLNSLEDNYETEIFKPIIKEIEKITRKEYSSSDEETKKAMRIIADHIRTSIFILGDDKQIVPSNTNHGYVLRRLIRRAIRFGKQIGIEKPFTTKIAKPIINQYNDYQELKRNHKRILEELEKEEEKFLQTLEKGLKKFEQISKDKLISGKEAFLLFQSYGFPVEMTEELANEKGIKIDLEEYNKEFKRHRDLSRTASQGKFKSGLADNSEATKKLHTATHILNEALRFVLKDKEIKQRGSNINPERLRFDFSFPRKLTEEEKTEVEKKVNEVIQAGLEITREEMPLNEAIESGAQSEFGTKYPEMVSVYTIHKPGKKDEWFSREICTGPHVNNTKEIGKFKIKKEESSSSGVRRIKAVLEDSS
jgi:alanyl-tRNA synthetase